MCGMTPPQSRDVIPAVHQAPAGKKSPAVIVPLPLGEIETWTATDGTLGIEHVGPTTIMVSLTLFAQQQPRIFAVRNGLIEVAGVNRAGKPTTLTYLATGFHPASPAAAAVNEGGFLVLELMGVSV